jgi:hypothetical protein
MPCWFLADGNSGSSKPSTQAAPSPYKPDRSANACCLLATLTNFNARRMQHKSSFVTASRTCANGKTHHFRRNNRYSMPREIDHLRLSTVSQVQAQHVHLA